MGFGISSNATIRPGILNQESRRNQKYQVFVKLNRTGRIFPLGKTEVTSLACILMFSVLKLMLYHPCLVPRLLRWAVKHVATTVHSPHGPDFEASLHPCGLAAKLSVGEELFTGEPPSRVLSSLGGKWWIEGNKIDLSSFLFSPPFTSFFLVLPRQGCYDNAA